MLVNGRALANDIQESLRDEFNRLGRDVTFSIIYVGEDPVIDNFIRYKKTFGVKVGVTVDVHRFSEDISTDELYDEVTMISGVSDAMIVQLPLPAHINIDTILSAVPVSKDVDVLSRFSIDAFTEASNNMFPPVAGAMVHILDTYKIDLDDKKIAIIGNGSLVGKPFALWLDQRGYSYQLFTAESNQSEMKSALKQSDIIVSGAGVPGLVTLDLVKPGVVLLDGGTSEAGKKVVGDVAPECADVAGLMTPVPGGIGPLTIAVLYQNILKAVQS